MTDQLRCTYHPDPDDHRLHFIGDPCCVAHGCEPHPDGRPMPAPESEVATAPYVRTHGTIHVDLEGLEPKFRRAHDDGRYTFALGPFPTGVDVVLTGTLEDLARLSGKLQAVAEFRAIVEAQAALDAVEAATR